MTEHLTRLDGGKHGPLVLCYEPRVDQVRRKLRRAGVDDATLKKAYYAGDGPALHRVSAALA